MSITIKSGNTLTGIMSKQLGRTPTQKEIKKYAADNGVKNPDLIFTGKKLMSLEEIRRTEVTTRRLDQRA